MRQRIRICNINIWADRAPCNIQANWANRVTCRCSLGSSQSSRCVFDKVFSSRISESGTSGTSLFLSCEGIVISSSSVGVSNATLPSSDAFNSPVYCCIIFLVHGENFSSLCTPPCSAEAQSCSRAPKCSGPKKGGKAAETTPGYSLIVYYNMLGIFSSLK